MKKTELINIIKECMNEYRTKANPNADPNEDQTARKVVVNSITSIVNDYNAGEKIESSELADAAEDKEDQSRPVMVSDVLFSRMKKMFMNIGKSNAVTFMNANPIIKQIGDKDVFIRDLISAKLGNDPVASTVVSAPLKGIARYARPERTEEPTEPTTAELTEKIKRSLRNLIKESLEEVKIEKEEETTEIMEELLKEVQKHSKSAEMVATPRGNFFVENCGNHHFDIRPMWEGSFDVVYIKNKADREKKFNLDKKELKEYVKAKLTNEGAYVLNAFNKNAENQKDQVKKVADLPNNTNGLTPKKVGDTKNENKDFNEKAVLTEDDQPDKPMAPVKTIKKQIDHNIKGEKAKYEYPSKSENKIGKKAKTPHVEKLKGKKLKS